MVKSGLSDKIIEENRAARVDHLRLVAHFGTALTIYCAMLWSGLDILQPGNKYDRSPQTVNALRKVRLGSKITFGLVSLTALYGTCFFDFILFLFNFLFKSFFFFEIKNKKKVLWLLVLMEDLFIMNIHLWVVDSFHLIG